MDKMRKAGRPRSFDPDEALHRALMVFWERGYEGASLALLQEATGLTAPQLYRAFESKERLFERAVRLYQEQYGFAMRSDLPLVEAVGDYLERAADEFTREPGRGCLVSTGLLATGKDAETAAVIVRAERDQALSNLRDRIVGAVEHGELSREIDVPGLARTIGALLQGMSVQARDGADKRELTRIADTARILLSAAAQP
ncbi:TetR/AcrR family transcriptional regulator [Rhodococcus sp. APC 3903]|uniref:TetR/AcrR family transcriptional regulator n=1 Tax=Rhodococcus sp. APC 3903 TaxID=3035193 RepID=UPI0025B55C15|nr:TetR/AcrR family transcriptional regulator [Rhodococcus sp. APC 3903]MDN3460897.1 helix-turn-helix domain-containing protein [Rhodococcus sp. APC 3903]